jgi:hypothetical protein
LLSERCVLASWGVYLDGGLSGLGRLLDLCQAAVLHIVNIAVDRDVPRHQGMVADTHNVLNHASGEVSDRVPFDELAVDRAWAFADVAPAGVAELIGAATGIIAVWPIVRDWLLVDGR